MPLRTDAEIHDAVVRRFIETPAAAIIARLREYAAEDAADAAMDQPAVAAGSAATVNSPHVAASGNTAIRFDAPSGHAGVVPISCPPAKQ